MRRPGIRIVHTTVAGRGSIIGRWGDRIAVWPWPVVLGIYLVGIAALDAVLLWLSLGEWSAVSLLQTSRLRDIWVWWEPLSPGLAVIDGGSTMDVVSSLAGRVVVAVLLLPLLGLFTVVWVDGPDYVSRLERWVRLLLLLPLVYAVVVPVDLLLWIGSIRLLPDPWDPLVRLVAGVVLWAGPVVLAWRAATVTTTPRCCWPGRCRSCGYPLFTVEGRCPECGHRAHDSLQDAERTGLPWTDGRRTPWAWLATAVIVLLRPWLAARRMMRHPLQPRYGTFLIGGLMLTLLAGSAFSQWYLQGELHNGGTVLHDVREFWLPFWSIYVAAVALLGGVWGSLMPVPSHASFRQAAVLLSPLLPMVTALLLVAIQLLIETGPIAGTVLYWTGLYIWRFTLAIQAVFLFVMIALHVSLAWWIARRTRWANW